MTRRELLAEATKKAGAWKQALGFASRQYRTGKHWVKTTPRDTRALFDTAKKMADPKVIDRIRVNTRDKDRRGFNTSTRTNFKRQLAKDVGRREALRKVRNIALHRHAKRAAGVSITAAAAYGGYRAIKRFRAHNRATKPQFRQYDVYPEHGYATDPLQRENMPVYYDDKDIGSGAPRSSVPALREAHELPKRITGFQKRRLRYKWTGIMKKMRSYPTHYQRWIKSKKGANTRPQRPLRKLARDAVQTPEDLRKGKRAINARVSSHPLPMKESIRVELINTIVEACV